MSAINIYTCPTNPNSTLSDPDPLALHKSKAPLSPSALTSPQSLSPPTTLIPLSALYSPALTSKTTTKKPHIEHDGPYTFDMNGSSDEDSESEDNDDSPSETDNYPKSSSKSNSSGKKKKKNNNKKSRRTTTSPQLKNGYLPKGTDVDPNSGKFITGRDRHRRGLHSPPSSPHSDDDDADDDLTSRAMAKGWNTHETSISTTVEQLEGGGKRTVWVRTERVVTVVVEGGMGDR